MVVPLGLSQPLLGYHLHIHGAVIQNEVDFYTVSIRAHAPCCTLLSFVNVSENRKPIRNVIRASMHLDCGVRALSELLFPLLRTTTNVYRNTVHGTDGTTKTMVLPHQGRQRKKTLKTLPADLIHMIAGELYKVGTPLDLYNLYRLVASPATAAPTVGTPLVESWLYRKVDLDFAGAESVGTTRLLKSLFDEKLDVRKYVRQLTVTIGPTAMRQGGAGFRQRRIALGRYLQYVLKMIPLLPNLKTFR